MATITPDDGSAWTLETTATAAGVALVFAVSEILATPIRLAITRDEARTLARGILAAAGDASERTFPRPRGPETIDG